MSNVSFTYGNQNQQPVAKEPPAFAYAKESLHYFAVVDPSPGSEQNPQVVNGWIEISESEAGAKLRANISWEQRRHLFPPRCKIQYMNFVPLIPAIEFFDSSSYPTKLRKLIPNTEHPMWMWLLKPPKR